MRRSVLVWTSCRMGHRSLRYTWDRADEWGILQTQIIIRRAGKCFVATEQKKIQDK